MKMKRFIAAKAHLAIEMVSAELGPDALILSNRKVPDGVEILAAVDYEEELLAGAPGGQDTAAVELSASQAGSLTFDRSAEIQENASSLQSMNREISSLRSMLEVPLSRLVWSETERQQPHRSALLARMAALGLHPTIANRVADQVTFHEDPEVGWRQSLTLLEGLLPIAGDDLLDEGGVVALVGPTGVGKTTTIAKLAARFALRHGRRQVALVTMDHYRIGAHDQLRTYGKLLGVPVHIAGDQEELQVIISQVYDKKLVLIDTAGTSQRDIHLAEQFAALNVPGAAIKRYLVMSATGEMALNDEIIQAFAAVNPERCILTKTDEAVSLGGTLSVLIKNRLPVVYVGDGQQVPDDFHKASAKQLVSAAADLAKQSGEPETDAVWIQALGGKEADSHARAHV